MRALSLIFAIFIYSQVAGATEYRLTYGVGVGLTSPGTARVGIGDWDIGLLGPYFIGAAKNFYLGGLPYMSFGMGVGSHFGFFGAMGLVGDLFWRFRWRTELQSAITIDGATMGGGILALEFKF